MSSRHFFHFARFFVPCASLAFFLAAGARATVIASDTFSYSTGELDGQNGGSGWAGAWSADTAYSDVADSPTMTYSYGNQTLGGGNNARVGDWPGGTNIENAAYRQLGAAFGDDSTETTIFVGFLVNFQGTLDYRDDMKIWLDSSGGTGNAGLHNSSPFVQFTNDYYTGSVDWAAGTTSSLWGAAPGSNMDASETHYIVAKFWKSDPQGANTFDSFALWFDPVAGVEGAPDATKSGDTNATLTSVQYVGLQLGKHWDAGDWMHVDGLKLGTSFDDVVPVPEPSTLALCGLGIAGLMMSRRKKSAKNA